MQKAGLKDPSVPIRKVGLGILPSGVASQELKKVDQFDGILPSGQEEKPKAKLPTLGHALRDPNFIGVDPKSVPAPPGILAAINAGKRVVILPHVPVDGDTLGSALGLANALEALGKHVVVSLDADVPSDLQHLDKRKFVHPSKLDPADFDLAVVVDVGQAHRIGESERLLKKVPSVVVIDHHKPSDNIKQSNLAPGAKLETWIEPGQDSASVMLARVATQLVDGKVDADQMAAITFPFLAGMYLDTDKYRAPVSRQDSLQIFKWMLDSYHHSDLGPLLKTTTHRLPEASLALLRGDVPTNDGVWARFTRRPNTALTIIPKAVMDEALRLAQLKEPGANMLDVRGAVMSRLDWMLGSSPFAAVVFEIDDGVQLSVRSKGKDEAVKLADLLGGGGQGQKAAANPAIPLEKVEAIAQAFMQRYELERMLKLKAGH